MKKPKVPKKEPLYFHITPRDWNNPDEIEAANKMTMLVNRIMLEDPIFRGKFLQFVRQYIIDNFEKLGLNNDI